MRNIKPFVKPADRPVFWVKMLGRCRIESVSVDSTLPHGSPVVSYVVRKVDRGDGVEARYTNRVIEHDFYPSDRPALRAAMGVTL